MSIDHGRASPSSSCATSRQGFGPSRRSPTSHSAWSPARCTAWPGRTARGKSTLIRVLTGALRRDSGAYEIDGRPVTAPTPAQCARPGRRVYQELSLLPHLSVAENLFMGRLPARTGIVARAGCGPRQGGARRGRPDGLSPDAIVDGSRRPPASSWRSPRCSPRTPSRCGVRRADHGAHRGGVGAAPAHPAAARARTAMLYVTHRLEEMFEIGDWVTVLRTGACPRRGRSVDYDEDRLIPSMSGARSARSIRRPTDTRQRPRCGSGDCAAPWLAEHRLRGRSRGDPRHRRPARAPGAASCCCPSSAPTRSWPVKIEVEGRPVKLRRPRAM